MQFELFDPFSECVYRGNSLKAMTIRAESLGANRFSITDDGLFVCHVLKTERGWETSKPELQNCALMQFGGV